MYNAYSRGFVYRRQRETARASMCVRVRALLRETVRTVRMWCVKFRRVCVNLLVMLFRIQNQNIAMSPLLCSGCNFVQIILWMRSLSRTCRIRKQNVFSMRSPANDCLVWEIPIFVSVFLFFVCACGESKTIIERFNCVTVCVCARARFVWIAPVASRHDDAKDSRSPCVW